MQWEGSKEIFRRTYVAELYICVLKGPLNNVMQLADVKSGHAGVKFSFLPSFLLSMPLFAQSLIFSTVLCT